MARPTVMLLAFLIAAAGAGSAPATVQPRPRAPVTIPFELVNQHVLVKAHVKNSRPLWFVLDTGANVAIVRTDTAKELGLSLEGTVSTGGAGSGRQAGQRVKDAKWSLAGLEAFSQPITLALPFPLLPAGLGTAVDGIVGGEFIKEFVLELDYQTRRITLHDRGTFKYEGPGEILPLEFNADGHPVVKARVTPVGGGAIEHKFHVDIGSGLALTLHSPFVTEHNLLGPGTKTIHAVGLAGAGGQSFGRYGRVSALQIGSFTINNPITLFSQDNGGAFANRTLAGNIGAQTQRRFRTFFDYGRKRMILEPSPAFAEPFDRAFVGIAVRAEGSDFRTFRVREVAENLPGAEAGIKEGDVITSVDGMGADKLTLTTLHDALDKEGPHEVTIRRGDETLKIMVMSKRVI